MQEEHLKTVFENEVDMRSSGKYLYVLETDKESKTIDISIDRILSKKYINNGVGMMASVFLTENELHVSRSEYDLNTAITKAMKKKDIYLSKDGWTVYIYIDGECTYSSDMIYRDTETMREADKDG